MVKNVPFNLGSIDKRTREERKKGRNIKQNRSVRGGKFILSGWGVSGEKGCHHQPEKAAAPRVNACGGGTARNATTRHSPLSSAIGGVITKN